MVSESQVLSLARALGKVADSKDTHIDEPTRRKCVQAIEVAISMWSGYFDAGYNKNRLKEFRELARTDTKVETS